MLKVFLVEDEVVVREGMKNNIDWSSHGYEFCGEASDGELAFPMIQKLQPDIVITDIQMPFMDGLALSRLVKKEYPWMEIIILTGYEKFEYAKEGIKIGVAEYLLKPVSSEELLKEVDALAIKIEERRQENEIKRKYRQEMEEVYRQERKNLFQYLVSGTKTVPELIEMAGKQNLNISAIWYNVLLLNAKSMNHAEDVFSKRIIEINGKIESIIDENHMLLFDRNLEGKALLIKADTLEDLQLIQAKFIEQIEEIFSTYDKIQYFGGIGKPVNRLRELPSSFENASHAFAHRYFSKESSIINSGALDNNLYQTEGFDIRNVDPKILNKDRIKEYLRTGIAEETKYFVEEFFKNMGKDTVESYMFRQYIAMDVYFCVAEFVEELHLKRDEIKNFDVTNAVLQSVDSTMKYVTNIIERMIELREKSARSHYCSIVDEVEKYVEKNYAQEELSLNLIASHVNFSPNHLSMIFSQETGCTFIKYLTDYRMNEAKKLLRCTGKRSSEISIEVGYRDPHYFSYLFKKTQGMTPAQYRGGKTTEEIQVRDRLQKVYNNLTLATKIRYSYILILIPMIIFLTICFYNLWNGNRKYEDMIKSAVVASEFSLDFKKEYDYETYLVIVENKTIEESDLDKLLEEANRVVSQLESKTDSGENSSRLKSVKKYLKNLAIYQERIKDNLIDGNKYEDNIEIWENDVQIVTSLLRESIIQYIYYEIRDLQQSRTEYQDFYVTMIRVSVIAFGLIVIVITCLSYFIPRSITSPIQELSKVTDQVAKGDLTVRSKVKSGAEVGTLSESLNTMIDKINELLEQVTNEQTCLRKAELELLQSQINPHFLYNTLDTIVWLEESGNHKQVVSMVKSLSEFFRTSLSQGKDVVTLNEELKHVRSYLEIQQVRYQDILEYEIDVPKRLESCLIPKITIQPLVENALYHGIKNKRGLGKIEITGQLFDDYFLLLVKDNGIGMHEKQLEIIKGNILHRPENENGNYGLYNVNERIRLKFGEEYGISMESTYMDGTTVSIRLPYREIE